MITVVYKQAIGTSFMFSSLTMEMCLCIFINPLLKMEIIPIRHFLGTFHILSETNLHSPWVTN